MTRSTFTQQGLCSLRGNTGWRTSLIVLTVAAISFAAGICSAATELDKRLAADNAARSAGSSAKLDVAPRIAGDPRLIISLIHPGSSMRRSRLGKI